ncbi:hypothetical protein ACOMHN_062151 [Nucella lapillus]
MRVELQGDTSVGEFSEMLLNVGNGAIPADCNGEITIPQGCGSVVDNIIDLLHNIYPNIGQRFYAPDWLQWLPERAILAPKNNTVDAMNNRVLQDFPGTAESLKSIDTIVDENQAVYYPVEFLNTLQSSGMPPHNLLLKVGAPIMLLINLDAPRLCTGTRLVVKTLMPHFIDATIMTGCAKGEDVFIPRIPIIPNDMLFEFKRLQFPIRLAFAMTINKAQGQSLKVAGIDLTEPCFSHGQFYVACSRVGTSPYPTKKTNNFVYPRALR